MPVEIERKFRVRDGRWRRLATTCVPMRQGYLGGDRCSIRVRREGDLAKLNIKSRELGIERLEFEYALPPDEAEALLAHFAGDLVAKLRHFVPHHDLVIEVDEFEGANAGLIVAEVELPTRDHPFVAPDWLGDEVTNDPRYYNLALARTPFSAWPDRDLLRYRD
jgi:adenylate cyclase